MPSLFLHIGLPRTGTTFLQRKVIPKIKSVNCFVKPSVIIGDNKERVSSLFFFNPKVWGKNKDNLFSNFMGKVIDEKDNKCLLLSDERMYGGVAYPQPWTSMFKKKNKKMERFGSIVRRRHRTNGAPDLDRTKSHVRKIAELASLSGFEETKVLLTIRRQDTWLASSYSQLSHRVRGASSNQFEDWAQHLTHDYLGYRMAGGAKLNYFEYWRTLAEVIGRDNVFIIPFELLKEDSFEFLNRWLTYLDIVEKSKILESVSGEGGEHVNRRSKTKRSWSLRDPISREVMLPAARAFRLLGLPTKIRLRWPDFKREQNITLSKALSENIMSVYRNSNKYLDNYISSVDLKKYKYY